MRKNVSCKMRAKSSVRNRRISRLVSQQVMHFLKQKTQRTVASSHVLVILTILFLSPQIFSQGNADWVQKFYAHAHKKNGFYYIRLQDAAEILGTHTYYSNKVRKAILYLGSDKLTVTAFNPFVLVGKRVVQMPLKVLFEDSDFLLPVKFFIPILQSVKGAESYLSGRPQPEDAENILAVHVEEKANGTLIRVDTAREFEQNSVSTRYSRKWLYLDIYGGKVNERTLESNIEKGLVRKFVPVQLEQMAQLSFQLKEDISENKINLTQHANEIWVSIPSRVNASSAVLERLKNDQKKWLIDKIVIDPGHGGKDPGAIGPRGTYEKNVVLAIAKKLKQLLVKNLDVDVVMTRDSDRYISLKERTKLANKQQAKLFISIHANWNRNSGVSGTTTYFLGPGKSEESIEIAQRENAVIKYDSDHGDLNLSEEQMILAALAQNAYNKESQDFAAMIQKTLNKKTGLKNRGVKQAGFYVLVGASMPNVLVETAFISNRREEKLLRSGSFQKKVAEGIFESIKKFKQRYEWTMSMK